MGKKDNEAIVNFEVNVLSFTDVYNSTEKKVDERVELSITFKEKNEESDPFTLSLSELDNFNWVEHNYRCQLPETNPTKAKRLLANQIRSKLTAPKKLYNIEKMGLHIIENEIVFCTESGIIRSMPVKTNSPIIEVYDKTNSLNFKYDLFPHNSIKEMLSLTSLCDAGRFILTYNLMWIMRSAYKATWNQPRFCLFLYADTSSFKTSYVKLLSNFKKIPPRLDSTLAASARIINDRREGIMIFDDLCPIEDTTQRRKQESLLVAITRWIGDETTPAKVSGNNVIHENPESGIIFTGEYEFGKKSSAARLLLVEVEYINEKILGFFQRNSEIVDNFYHLFIEWYVSNYYGIEKHLKKFWYDYYSIKDVGVLRRLRETQYYFETSHMLLMDFCMANKVITEEKAKIYHQSFLKKITYLIEEQDKRARPDVINAEKVVDYLANIRALYKNGWFRLVANPGEFTVNHDGISNHDGCLCLYSNRFNQVTCKANFSGVNINDIWDSIEEQGALIRNKEGKRTTQINCNKKTPHFYKIPLEKLK